MNNAIEGLLVQQTYEAYRAAPSTRLADPPHNSIRPFGKKSPRPTDYEIRMPPKKNWFQRGQNRGQRSKGQKLKIT